MERQVAVVIAQDHELAAEPAVDQNPPTRVGVPRSVVIAPRLPWAATSPLAPPSLRIAADQVAAADDSAAKAVGPWPSIVVTVTNGWAIRPPAGATYARPRSAADMSTWRR